jgi:ATP-dependent DNA helicase RecQ
VFNDKTLTEMAQIRPRTPAQLLAVSGVGMGKLARYGDDFLAELAR